MGMNSTSTLIAILHLSTSPSDLIRSAGGTDVRPRFRRFISMLSILWQYLQCQLNVRESSAAQRSSSHRITPERNRLTEEIIEASECLKNWWDRGLIQQLQGADSEL